MIDLFRQEVVVVVIVFNFNIVFLNLTIFNHLLKVYIDEILIIITTTTTTTGRYLSTLVWADFQQISRINFN